LACLPVKYNYHGFQLQPLLSTATATTPTENHVNYNNSLHEHRWIITNLLVHDNPPGIKASIIRYLSQARKIGRVATEKAFGIKMGDDESGGTRSLDGVAFRRIVGASASVIFLCTIKARRWRAIMEEVDKGCSKFVL